MKTDIEPGGSWLVESTRANSCPLCSKPLQAQAKTCFSCGFSLERATGSAVWIDPAVYAYAPSDTEEARPLLPGIPERRKFAVQPRKQPNPPTPIPPRASAQSSGSMKALPTDKRQGRDGHEPQQARHHRKPRKPHSIAVKNTGKLGPNTTQPLIWQYETPKYEAESSLPSLTLLVAEMPTQPEILLPEDDVQQVTGRSMHIDEIDTVPPHLAAIAATQPHAPVNVDEIDTQPNLPNIQEVSPASQPIVATRAVVPALAPAQVVEGDASSWTGGEASAYAQFIADRKKKRPRAISLNPIDRVRWWLLHPGRLEFILWLGGTILLIAMTCILLLVTAFSFDWITPISGENTVSTGSFDVTPQATQVLPTVTTTPGLTFSLLDTRPLLPGQSFHVRGEGFSPHGRIAFTLDGMQPLPDASGQPSWAESDEHGAFTAALYIGSTWTQGIHLVIARDVTTNRLAALSITIAPNPIGKATTPTPNPPASGFTPVPTQGQGSPGTGNGGGGPTPQPSPVNKTPVPSTPTPTPTQGVTPTPTQPAPTPTPSPTSGITPTPTPGITSTPGITPSPTGDASLAQTNHALLGSALNAASPANTSLSMANPLVWLMLGSYLLAMLMLGIAGVLYKKRK
jgi:hypothetical protein